MCQSRALPTWRLRQRRGPGILCAVGRTWWVKVAVVATDGGGSGFGDGERSAIWLKGSPMIGRVDAQFDSDGGVVRRRAVTRALAGWAGVMALICFLAATGMRTTAGRSVVLAVAVAMTLVAVRALRVGVIAVRRHGVIARTLLRTVHISPEAARFEVVERRGMAYLPYSSLALVRDGKLVLLREFSTSISNDRAWLDSLAAVLNAAVTQVLGATLDHRPGESGPP
jgi:hypothetical protein